MGLLNAIFKKVPEEELYEEEYDEREEYGYGEDDRAWEVPQSQYYGFDHRKVVMIAPREYDDGKRVANCLGESLVIMSLTEIEPRYYDRLLDFVRGACFFKESEIKEIAADVFLIIPKFVSMEDYSGLNGKTVFV